MKRPTKLRILLFTLLLLTALAGCAAPAAETPTPAPPTDTQAPPPTETATVPPSPTATDIPAPTPTDVPENPSGAAYESACLDCHLDQDRLMAVADPEPTVVAESEGEG